MRLLGYAADILPEITFIGKDTIPKPHLNIRRISEDYIFYMVTSGEMFFVEDKKEYHLKAGDLFLFEPGKLHFGTQKSDYSLIYIHFTHPSAEIIDLSEDEWMQKVSTDHRNWITGKICNLDNQLYLPKIIHFNDSADFFELVAMAEAAIRQNKMHLENYNLATSLEVSRLFVGIYRNFASANLNKEGGARDRMQLVNEVIKFLNQNYQNKITGDIIEKNLCYNFDYLNQIFKSHLGTSIFKTLENIRIEAAEKLLKTSDVSLESVAESVGFKNESYFSKVFKKVRGVPPSKYRSVLATKPF